MDGSDKEQLIEKTTTNEDLLALENVNEPQQDSLLKSLCITKRAKKAAARQLANSIPKTKPTISKVESTVLDRARAFMCAVKSNQASEKKPEKIELISADAANDAENGDGSEVIITNPNQDGQQVVEMDLMLFERQLAEEYSDSSDSDSEIEEEFDGFEDYSTPSDSDSNSFSDEDIDIDFPLSPPSN